MPKNDVTAIVLAKNEAETLSTCLGSLTWCDHIIVGDDGSSDDTIRVAKEHHADVIKLAPTDSFAKKRNILLEYVRTEWTLFIDADEVVTDQLRNAIGEAIGHRPQATGFLLRRMDVFLGRKLLHGETATTWILRLGKTQAGKWKRRVHEIWDIQGNVGKLEGEILHYSHPNLEEFLEKINRYTELEADERNKVQGSRDKEIFVVLLQLFLFPGAKFIQNYILRLGFLDGFPGFVMAYMMSLHSLCVRIKVIEKLRQKN